MRKWRAANADRVRESRRQYYALNKERTKREAIEWAKNNSEIASLHKRASSANQAYPGQLAYADVVAIIERDGKICHWCSKTDLKGRDLTLDHLKPINSIGSITVSCLRCNASRWAPNWGRIPTVEERKARFAEYHKQYYQRNKHKFQGPQTKAQKDRRRDYMRRYEAANRDRLTAYRREWRLSHPRSK